MNVYQGRSRGGVMCVTVNGSPLPGYLGSGPAQLALALLLHVTGDPDLAEENYRDFKREFVAGWGERWEVTADQIREWLSLSKTRAE